MRPEDYTGLEESIAAVDEALRPASIQDRAALLGEMMLVLPPPNVGTKAASKVRWAAYHEALADLPAEVLSIACARVKREATFFPKPAEIRRAASEPWGVLVKFKGRLAALRDFKVKVRSEESRRPTPEEMARRKQAVARYRREAGVA
ncbi:hypothetical protein DBT53_002645, partial [Aerococcus mictus]|uniref:hypothetical protein n=1 Tax=Aerococcus mictus TaxID=2976810 RepID=UPI002FD6118B